MQTDSIELGFLSIFALITFFVFLIISKYSYKISNGVLMDDDFNKPQAFHHEVVSRSGGIASVICLLIFLGIYYLLYSQVLYEYVFICSSLFFLGYLDDTKIKIDPNIRLSLMVIFLIIFINVFDIYISNIDLIFLNFWLENKIFYYIYTFMLLVYN